jgi:hypothetical protein
MHPTNRPELGPELEKVRLLLPLVARTIRWIPIPASSAIALWIVYAGTHSDRPTNIVQVPLAGLVVCAAAGFLLDDEAAETVASSPTSLLVRRGIRVALGLPLIWAIWGVLAWYAAGLTASASLEFAGMLALTLALAGVGGIILGEERAGLFSTPALFVALGASAILSNRWQPFPLTPLSPTWFDRYARWGIVLIVSLLVFLLTSADPAKRRPARRVISGVFHRRGNRVAALTHGHVA